MPILRLKFHIDSVVDASCREAKQTTTQNPCNDPLFSCSPAPIVFTALHLDGLEYVAFHAHSSSLMCLLVVCLATHVEQILALGHAMARPCNIA